MELLTLEEQMNVDGGWCPFDCKCCDQHFEHNIVGFVQWVAHGASNIIQELF